MASVPRRTMSVSAAVILVVALTSFTLWFASYGHGGGTPSRVNAAPGTPGTTSAVRPSHGALIPSPSLGTSFTPGTGATEAVRPQQTKPAVPMHATATISPGLTARIVSLKAISGHAIAPGEISGPALRIAVWVRNASHRQIPLSGSTVLVTYSHELTPAVELSSGEHKLSGTLRPHDSTTGIYVFTVPPNRRDDVQVQLNYLASAPTVEFHGAA